MGLAIGAAARDARAQLVEWARTTWRRTVRPSSRHAVGCGSATRSTIGELLSVPSSAAVAGECVGRGYLRKHGADRGDASVLGGRLRRRGGVVDEPTGEIRVERLVTVGDVGCAINPQLVEGQDIGAAMMGLGMATREELVYQDGNLMNGNLFDYRVPRTRTCPSSGRSSPSEVTASACTARRAAVRAR